MGRDGVNRYLKKMYDAKLIHIAAYSLNINGGQPAPRYSIGEAPDAVYVKSRAPKRHLIVGERLAAVEQCVRYHHSASEIAEKLGLTNARVRFYLQELRKLRPVYICAWRQLPAGIAPVYALGKKPDAPKPIRTRAMAYAETVERYKADPELNDKLERTKRLRAVRNRIEQTKKKPHNIFSALGL